MSVIIGGIYKHYKGNLYKVIGVAKHSETLEELVVYQAQYGSKDIWVRPYEMFCEQINLDDKIINRFEFIGETQTKIYIEIPDDINIKFFENGIDIKNELYQEVDNISVENVISDSNAGTKDAALVILALGTSISAVIICVAKLIRAISDRPRTATITELDKDGNVISKKTTLLEPEKNEEKFEMSAEFSAHTIKFNISNENK